MHSSPALVGSTSPMNGNGGYWMREGSEGMAEGGNGREREGHLLEGKAQYGYLLAADGVEHCANNDLHETLLLVVVHLDGRGGAQDVGQAHIPSEGV